jgi:putative holliday junction resolvase
MPRILAVDFGERRIGLATCDQTGQVVTPRQTLARRSDADAVRKIARFCADEEVEAVVLGVPRSPEGRESAFADRVRSFGTRLSQGLPVPVRYHEETLTSWQAQRSAPFLTKEEIDREAAAILLSDYLSHKTEGSR